MSTRPCIVVTGASRGIGAAIVQVLATAGYEVGCLSRSGALPAW
ncbi:MAG: SDR family NAD(P)-dependent oxidoreductase, partial [Betaproteobacteria bacterium]|nr:SDR family NAD(P)-dependent oxidoreductase [Betaproteobacteria bacterium]